MQKYTATFAFFLLLAALGILGFLVYHPANALPPQSTFSLHPTAAPILSPTKTPEPFITQWSTYTNNTYNFTIDYPTGWNQQEYTGPYGAKTIAFSPNDLPCTDCSYVHDGFFSIKIYNQKTDPQGYTDFLTRKQNVGKSKDYIGVEINNIFGVLFGNTVAIENNGYVYETSLDTDNGTDKATDSKIFQKATLSLQFTNIIFDN